MRIQYLTVIFVIITLPIIIITSVYNRMQIKTINLQKEYDSRLIDATYDAIKAYQINISNNENFTAANSRRRDVEAAIETFITSLSTGLGIGGYGTQSLKTYIPAILFTLYDGYYIYAPTENETEDGTKIQHMLKPRVKYSQRYVHGDTDVVICYTLDNYMTVYGKVGTEYVRKSGYLNYYLLNESIAETKETLSERLFVTKEFFATYTKKFKYIKLEDDTKVYFDEQKNLWFKFDNTVAKTAQYIVESYNINECVGEEILEINGIDYGFDYSKASESTYVERFIKEYKYFYREVNGYKIKTYFDEEYKRYFTYSNAETSKKIITSDVDLEYPGDESYYTYIKNSKEFTQWVVNKLGQLQISDARGPGNDDIEIFKDDTTKFLSFSEYNKPEEANSLYATHKREVIKLSIENNLASAINNYDKISVALDSTYHFKMPIIKENEWDKILNNISLVTFVQGLPTGFKTYNNYSIVTSTTNEEYVTDDTIYFTSPNSDVYHRIGCQELDITQGIVGYRNSDFQKTKKTIERGANGSADKVIYYYKHTQLPCYYCIVNRIGSRERNIFDINSSDYNLADANERRKQFYKALGRERYTVMANETPMSTK